MLLERAEQWAKESGYKELAMDTAEQATHLIELYTRLGYRHVGWVQWPVCVTAVSFSANDLATNA